MKIEVGKYYKNTFGAVIYISNRNWICTEYYAPNHKQIWDNTGICRNHFLDWNLIEEVTIPKLNIGDKVELLDNYSGLTKGAVGTINKLLKNSDEIPLADIQMDNGRKISICTYRLKLLEGDNMKFKKGDKVECLYDFQDVFTKGKIYEIEQYGNSFVFVIDDSSKITGSHKSNFKLVSSDNLEEKTNEELLEIFQKGLKAKKELRSKNAKLEYKSNTDGKWKEPLPHPPISVEWRLKPIPKFEPFQLKVVGSRTAYQVEFDQNSNDIKVGCQSIDLFDLRVGLQEILLKNFSMNSNPRIKLNCTSKGIQYKDWFISYEEATKLLEAIKDL